MKKKEFKIDFIGIGVARAATTWIWENLKEHNEVCMPNSKRVPFFGEDKYYSKGLNYYKGYFRKCSKSQKKGQISDSLYLFSEMAFRIKNYFPNVKIIISLRNPIEALYSLYYFSKRLGNSRFRSFSEAIRDEKFINRGLYYKKIKKWLKVFPKDNFLFLIYEDIEKNPVTFIQSIFSFIGVDSSFVPSLTKKRINSPSNHLFLKPYTFLNLMMRRFYLTDLLLMKIKNIKFLRKIKKIIFSTNKKKDREKIKKKDQKYLKNIFLSDIEKTEELIDKDLSHWK